MCNLGRMSNLKRIQAKTTGRYCLKKTKKMPRNKMLKGRDTSGKMTILRKVTYRDPSGKKPLVPRHPGQGCPENARHVVL